MTSSLPRSYAPFTAAYPHRRRSQSPPKSDTTKLYNPFLNSNQAQEQPLYPDTQISQFSVPSSAPVVQIPLPPLRDLHQPSFDARRLPSTTQNLSSYRSQDVLDPSSTLGSPITRVAESTYRASELAGADLKTSSANARSIPSSSSQRPQVSPLYLPVVEATTRDHHTQPSTPWYPSPTPHEVTLDDQSLTFPIRDDMSTSFPIRDPFSPLLDPALSSVAPTQSAYSQPDSISFTALPTDPQLHSHHQSYIPVQPQAYARLRTTTPRLSRLSSTPSSSPVIRSPGSDSYLHAAALDPQSPDALVAFDNENRRGSIGPSRVDLAPLHALQRSHPYRRDPVDEGVLRMLGPRSS
jgi:hypothetical protein